MTMSRRQTLALMGGGVVLAAGLGATAFARTRTPEAALAPWQAAGGYADARLNALSHAILAPNPHNQQPWLVQLVGEDEFLLHVNPDKLLPETDPFDRQITIGLGCFLEQMRIAATATGHEARIAPFPEGVPEGRLDARPVAHVRLVPGATRDLLVAAIPHRRSTKEPFDMARGVDAAMLAPFAGSRDGIETRLSADADEVAAIRDLMWQAWLVEYETPAALQESIDVMRLGRAEIEASPDGIDIGGPFLEGLMLAGLLDRESLGDPSSMGYAQGLEMYRAMIEATPAAVWLVTPDNSRHEQLRAGAAWLRLNLATTAAGLALHPVSQALQEYPEMREQHARAHAMLAPEGGVVQMLGRIGFAGPVPQTPRWSLDAKLLPT